MTGVLLVDDDALVRTGLSMVLGGLPDITVVGEVANGAEVPAAVRRLRPDVVLMDIRMPVLDGIAATAALVRAAGAQAPAVIVLTTFDTGDHVVDALRAGAAGFLLKDTPPTQIVEAIRRVAAGEQVLSPAVTRRLIEQVSRPEAPERLAARAFLASLTERERAVARAVACGESNAEIAARLNMATATVKSYVSRLLDRMHASNRVQLAIRVHEAGD